MYRFPILKLGGFWVVQGLASGAAECGLQREWWCQLFLHQRVVHGGSWTHEVGRPRPRGGPGPCLPGGSGRLGPS